MLNRKFLIICLIICVFTIANVSASDLNDTDIISDVSDEVLTQNASSGSFSDLSTLIGNTAPGGVLELDKDYKNTESTNSIAISKAMTIDGKGHTIDANSKTGIFDVSSENVALKNIKFINAPITACKFEESGCSVINCSFNDCSNYNSDGEECLYDGIVSLNSGRVINCSFTNCMYNTKNTIYGGVLSVANTDVVNCSFKNCCYGCDLVYGGAISSENDRIINCTFTYCGYNSNLVYGGAINMESTLIRNCSFSHCGDGCELIYGNAIEGAGTIADCSFNDCSINSKEVYGGDMHFTGPGNLTNCDFSGKYSGVQCNYFCIGNITNCTFEKSSNNAIRFWGKGGNVTNCTFKDCKSKPAIEIDDYHKINLIGCIFINCVSNEDGGAIYNYAHDFEFFEGLEEENEYENGTGLHVVNCTFEKCSAKYNGGAIYFQAKSEGSIDNCSFKSCTSGKYGGAIYIGSGADARVLESAFKNNNANAGGGAIYGGIIFDCVLIGNSKPQISSPDDYSTIVHEEMQTDDDGVVSLRFPSDATGTLAVFVDGNMVGVAKIVKGIASIDLSEFKGDIVFTFVYSGDDNYNGFTKESNVTIIIIPAKIIVKNLNLAYTSNKQCIITVYEKEGVIAVGAKVIILINNKVLQTPKTNSKGVVSFKVTKTPGTYTLTLKSLEKTVVSKLTVKHVVSLKSATVKKSAKKLVLTASLAKVDGKYLKKKKVTFKFNGKKYTAKTNKKGVAKVTIKSSVLKKLKVGKKVTYQVTYLKDTIKKTSKIKK